MLDGLDDGLVVVDRDLRVLHANPALTGGLDGRPIERTTADLLERHGFTVVRADGSPWPLAERPVQLAAQQGVATERALMGLERDGTTRWVRVSARPLRVDGEVVGAVGTYRDVTARESARHALAESEAHFRLLAENSTDVISRHAADGRLTYASPAITDTYGWRFEDVVDRNPMEFVHPEDAAEVVGVYEQVLRDGRARTFRYRYRHADGRWVWSESVVRPVVGEDGRLHEMQTATRDITERVEGEERLTRLALADPLTGLANRAALVQRLEDVLERGERLALLFLDLDRFKVVNDSLGHSAGDELLRTVAGRLAGTVRDADLVARLGGDEFVVVGVGLDEAGGLLLAERVQRVLATPIGVAGHDLVVSASVGIVAHDGGGEQDPESLLRDADVSMYRAKAKGRARAVVWSEALSGAASTRLALERDLREALATGAVVAHYQPQVDLRTGHVVGVEALARWESKAHGLLLPGAFLEVAEDSGLVVELGRQVVEAAVAQVAAWRALPGCADLALSVNLCAVELLAPGRAGELARVLDAAGLPASAVTVEVLESVLLDADGDVRAALAAFAAVGVRLALDDFGTGSSSLLHLRDVPVAEVKVDRTFVSGLGTSRSDEAIVRAVRVLADDLGLGCVAEGVEEPAQRDWLLDHGVGTAQGFLLGRPVDAPTLEQRLRSTGGTTPAG